MLITQTLVWVSLWLVTESLCRLAVFRFYIVLHTLPTPLCPVQDLVATLKNPDLFEKLALRLNLDDTTNLIERLVRLKELKVVIKVLGFLSFDFF